MRKILSIFTILTLISILVGCSGEEKTTLVKNENGYKSEMIFYHKDDKVTKLETTETVPYEFLQIDTKKEAEEIFKEQSKEMDAIEGVTVTTKFDEDSFTEKIVIEYKKLDIKKANEMLGLSLGDNEDAISMSEQEKSLLELGYEKK